MLQVLKRHRLQPEEVLASMITINEVVKEIDGLTVTMNDVISEFQA